MTLLLVELGERLLGGLAFGDVANGRGDQGTVRGLQGAETDLDRKLAPVPAQPCSSRPAPIGRTCRSTK